MNILLVTAMFPPIRTGTSFYSRNLAEALVETGHQVVVVTVRNIEAHDDKDAFKLERLPALHFPVKNYFKHLRFCACVPQNYATLSRIVRETKSDVILLVNHYLDIAFPAIFAARRNRIPLVVSVGTQLQSLNPIRHKILNILDRLICGTCIFPFAQKIISWDTEIERYLREVQSQHTVAKSVIVPFGVNGDPEMYQRHQHDYARHHQILGIGAIIDHRNFVFQIQVFRELLKTYPTLTLKIIGHRYIDAPCRLAQELNIQDNVIFAGELPHEDVLAELQKSDLHWMMLTSTYKGMGTSNLEAMLMGVPIISNVPDNLFGEGLLTDLDNYIYTDGMSVEATAAKIQRVLDDAELRREIGQNGRQFVQEHMNWNVVAHKMETVLESVIQEYSSKRQ